MRLRIPVSVLVSVVLLAACGGPETEDVVDDPADSADGKADAATVWGGSCTAAFPGRKGSWDHSVASPAVTLAGSPNHRIRDVVVAPGERTSLRIHFAYGPIDKDLEDETIELWLRRCPSWELLGRVKTDDDGIVFIDLPSNLKKGEYVLRAIVKGDGSTVDGLAAVWPSGTQAIVTDVDGTLTTSDAQALEDIFLGRDAKMYTDANTVMKRWAAKKYRILYLTGRPQIWNGYSRRWLNSKGFPQGPVMLTDDAGQVMPSDSGVRVFKAGKIAGIEAKGVLFRAAYGNATTDIGAYDDAGLPKADTFIVGPHAGEKQTQKITSYTAHRAVVDRYPTARQP